MTANKTCGFLAYLNRSGSTLLARLLNEYRDIAVGIEGLEPRFLHHEPERFRLRDPDELDCWLNRVYQDDRKFRYWGIDRNRLQKSLLKTGFPISFHEFLRACLELYFRNDPARVLIHKAGRHFHNLKKSQKVFPGWKYVYIDRDPRGIFNSQKKSLDSVTRRPMNTDIVGFALYYKNQQIRIRNYRKKPEFSEQFILVHYENILNDREDLARILNFFHCSGQKSPPGKSYREQLPREQRYLHQLVSEKPHLGRVTAWQKELRYDEIAFLNRVLKRQLKDNGYDVSFWPKWRAIPRKGTFIRNIAGFCLRFYPRFYLKSLLFFLRLRRCW